MTLAPALQSILNSPLAPAIGEGVGVGPYHATAQKLLASIATAATIATIASPVTATTSSAFALSTINGVSQAAPTVVANDARLQPLCALAPILHSSPYYKSKWWATTSDAALDAGGSGWGQRFVFTERYLEVGCFFPGGATHFIQLKIDGKWVKSTAYSFVGDGTSRWVKWDLGSAASRVVEAYFSYGMLITGYDGTGGTSSFAAPSALTTRAQIIGDSFVFGTNSADVFGGTCKDNLGGAFAEAFGIVDFVISGTAGAGWVRQDASYSKTIGDRVPAGVTRMAPVDLLIPYGSINDAAQSTASITANVTSELQAIQAANPATLITFVSGWQTVGTPIDTAHRNAARDGALAAQDARTLVIDAEALGWPSIAGTHPTYAECQTMAQEVLAQVSPWLATL